MKQQTMNRMAGLTLLLISMLIATPSHAATRPADSEINVWVMNAIHQDPRIASLDVTAATESGIVTLSGRVATLAAFKYAELETKKIRGVLGVINEIVVEPAWRSDKAIHEAVARRIASSPVIASDNILTTVIDGKVILSGVVDSWADRDQAELIASEVAGVKQVVNDIMTRSTANRTDEEILSDTQATLARDVYLTGLPITVTVDKGVVNLTGIVGNAYERDRAADDARWVRGVADVSNNLDVDWLFDRGSVARRRVLGDDEIKAAVRAELDQDRRLDPTGISIGVDMGTVTLKGTVYSRAERRIAELDAKDVVGVAWVNNRLFAQVDARDDKIILNDVDFKLDTDFATADLDIGATINHGTVTLSGEVDNWYERSRAAMVAADVTGVKEVVNHITVASSSWKLDADLTASLKHNLTWNWTTWWVHDDIGVTVHNGVATLSGDVNNWAERTEATNVALNTPGVWKVDNRLTVDGYNYPWSEYYYHGPYEVEVYTTK